MKRSPGQRTTDRVPRGRQPRARGTVLIVSIWIMLVLVGTVLVMARAMRVEGGGSANHAAALEASAIQFGAIQYVQASVDGLAGQMPSEQEMPCEGVIIGNGAFWIIRSGEDDREQSYGVVSEAGKVNLNTAPTEILTELPEMTAEFAAAIVDWRDRDGDLTPGGAESEYYLLLPDPYECKNDPLETVEEVMLVAGASEQILFGEDASRNGVLDDNENDSDQSDPPDDRDGHLDTGIYGFATVYSVEANLTASGEQRVNINSSQMQQLASLLREALGESRALEVMVLARRERPFQNVLDFYFRTTLKKEEFESIADKITVTQDEDLRGLIDVRTAPEEVLASLPGLDESDVAALLEARPDADAEQTSIAWVAEALPPEKAVAIGSYITTRSYQFSADIVSVSGNGRAFKRCRVVVDTRESPPMVIYRQDLTHLGWPLPQEILAELRSGTPVEKIVNGDYQEIR
jgi:DNA uptake protein ComE-like DNA-binding protein